MVKSLKDAPVSKEARVELKFARSVEAPAVNSELTDAYEALKNADYRGHGHCTQSWCRRILQARMRNLGWRPFLRAWVNWRWRRATIGKYW